MTITSLGGGDLSREPRKAIVFCARPFSSWILSCRFSSAMERRWAQRRSYLRRAKNIPNRSSVVIAEPSAFAKEAESNGSSLISSIE